MSPLLRSALYRFGLPALFVVTAATPVVLFPKVPDFLPMMIAVMLSAFVGGTWVGVGTLAITMPLALVERLRETGGPMGQADVIASVGFTLVGILFLAIIDLHNRTVAGLNRQQRRTDAALHAAKAAVWELSPNGELYWDDNFYRLVGLDPQSTPPSTPTFLSMIHPDDRGRMAEARQMMDRGIEPHRVDEYRLIRPDGEEVWMENHRTRISESGDAYFIGVTQDITRRKRAEGRVQALLREADHRAKNQFSVIMAIARETRRTAASPAEFDEAFGTRLRALARSHDLLVKGEWTGTTLKGLLTAQLEPFSNAQRYEIVGPDMTVPPSVAQHLGMAFHELATNAAKHGALATPDGRILIHWEIRENSPTGLFALTWREQGGKHSPDESASPGFGTRVLLDLVPSMLGGEGRRTFTPDGLVWSFTAPLGEIVGPAEPSPA